MNTPLFPRLTAALVPKAVDDRGLGGDAGLLLGDDADLVEDPALPLLCQGGLAELLHVDGDATVTHLSLVNPGEKRGSIVN